MKTVALIASYKPKPLKLNAVVSELKKCCNRIIIFAAEEISIEGCEVVMYDKSIVDNLVFEPRKWIVNNIDGDWDYVLYNEDDILIKEEAFRNALMYQAKMEYPNVCGFLRFENFDGKKWWIDQHPDHGVHTGNYGKQVLEKNNEFWSPVNFHSGNYLLSKEYVKKMISENIFETSFNEKNLRYCGPAETGASGHYRRMKKLIPLEFQKVECEHLDNKYYHHPTTPDTEELKRILSL